MGRRREMTRQSCRSLPVTALWIHLKTDFEFDCRSEYDAGVSVQITVSDSQNGEKKIWRLGWSSMIQKKYT